MSAKPFKQSSESTDRPVPANSYVSEALARQAAQRPPKTPPREMPVTPTLPRQPNKRRRRRA